MTTNIKLRYKRRCKILTHAIKKKYYDELISKSKNKTKTICKIINKGRMNVKMIISPPKLIIL